MKYVVHYAVASALFFSITLIHYFRQKRIANLRDQLYSAMLITEFLAVVFDLSAVLAEKNAMAWPVPLLFGVNFISLLSMHTCLIVTCFYILAYTGLLPQMKRWQAGVMLLPYLTILTLLVLSTVTKIGIFYIGEDHIYRYGATHGLLYVVTGVYIFSIVGMLLARRKVISVERARVIIVFVGIMSLIIGVQILLPKYLLTTSATAFALIMLNNLLQTPGDYIEPSTELFNRQALDILLKDLFEQNQHFMILLLPIGDFSLLRRTFGGKTGDALQLAYAKFLKSRFLNCYILHISASTFAVVRPNVRMGKADFLQSMERFPERWTVANTEVALPRHAALIHSDELENAGQAMAMIDILDQELKGHKEDYFRYVDKAYAAYCRNMTEAGNGLRDALARKALQVWYRPVRDNGGAITGIEADGVYDDPELGFVRGKQCVALAERTNRAVALGEQILQQTCRFLSRHDEALGCVWRVYVPLFPAQRMQPDTWERVYSIVNGQGIRPERICFCVGVTEASSAMPASLENMQRLSKLGFSFSLNHFGAGFSDLADMARVRFAGAKIDGSILLAEKSDGGGNLLLHAVCDMARKLEIMPILQDEEHRFSNDWKRRAPIGPLLWADAPMEEDALLRMLENGEANR